MFDFITQSLFFLQRRTFYEPDVHIQMSIDSFSSNTGSKKEDWRRLADVRITSQVDATSLTEYFSK